jgi:hypothetical protein
MIRETVHQFTDAYCLAKGSAGGGLLTVAVAPGWMPQYYPQVRTLRFLALLLL